MDLRKILDGVNDEEEVVLLKSFIIGGQAVVEKNAKFEERDDGLHIGIELSDRTEFVPVEIFTSATVMSKMEFALLAMKMEADENAPIVVDEANQL